MNITEVKIRKLLNDGRLRGIVSVTIDGTLAVHDIKIVQGEKRLFVAMPSRRDDNGIYRDIVHPITISARNEIEEEILDAFQRELDLAQTESPAAEDGDMSGQDGYS